MDPRTYVTLEQTLVRKLRKDWQRRADKLLTAIELAVAEEKYDQARALTLELDLTDLGQENSQFIRYLFQSLVVFGAKSISDIPGVLIRHETPDFLEKATSTFLQYLEFSGTRDLHKQALQLIARAESGVQKADEPQRKVKPFVSFKDMGDDQIQLISSLHSSRLAVWGFTAEAEISNVTRYRLNAVLDGRTSDFCRFIHGKEFDVVDARTKIMQVLSAQDPDDLKTLQPWPNQSKAGMEEIKSLTSAQLVQRGLHIPPFHPGCRTLLALVSRVSRLEKPKVVAPVQGLDQQMSTVEQFKQIGLALTPQQVDHWNAYVGTSPIEWLAKLSGVDPLKVLEGVFGKNAIKISPDGDILTKVKGLYDGSKFQVGTILEPYTGKLYLSQAEFLKGDAGAEFRFVRSLLTNLLDTGMAMASPAVVVSVGDLAYHYGRLGFVPTPARWQEIRQQLMGELTEGSLNKALLSLDEEQQKFLLNLLSNPNEDALGVLVDLPWTYRGQPFAQVLLDGIDGEFELDLTNPMQVQKFKDYLQ